MTHMVWKVTVEDREHKNTHTHRKTYKLQYKNKQNFTAIQKPAKNMVPLFHLKTASWKARYCGLVALPCKPVSKAASWISCSSIHLPVIIKHLNSINLTKKTLLSTHTRCHLLRAPVTVAMAFYFVQNRYSSINRSTQLSKCHFMLLWNASHSLNCSFERLPCGKRGHPCHKIKSLDASSAMIHIYGIIDCF